MKKGYYFLLVIIIMCNMISCGNNSFLQDETEMDVAISPEGIATSNVNQEGYYISITGSYQKDGILSEVYATYEIDTGDYKEHLKVPATSSYPCCVCDLTEGKVYYTAAEESVLNGRTVLLDNIYIYDISTTELTMLTTDGFFSNKMIKVDDRLYIAGAPRSTLGVRFCWVDLDTTEIVYPDLLQTPGYTNVRDIAYSFQTDKMYLTWYDGKEQSRLDAEYSLRWEDENLKENIHELTPRMLDVVDMKTLEIETLEVYTDFQAELISPAQDGSKVFVYGMEAEVPIRIHENGSSVEYIYPGTALALLDADGDTIYYIQKLEKETEGVPHTALFSYNATTGEKEELLAFPFYVNNMVMMKK